ncbi:MlaD family protein [Methylomagnum sp.]
MSKPANTRLIGLFVLGALALAVALVLAFGGGRYFGSAQQYVAYFQGSVNGLNVGALVKLKGVNIGRVTDILVQYDTAHNRVLTPVVMQVDFRKVVSIGEDHQPARALDLPTLIERGLRARLSMQSLVTSQLFVDVNFYPDKPVQLVGAAVLGLPEIPTIASGRDELENTVQDTVAKFRELPLKETVESTRNSLRRVEQLLSKPETDAAIANLNRTLEELQKLIQHMDGKVDAVTGNLNDTVQDSHALVKSLNERVVPLLAITEKTMAAIGTTAVEARGSLAAVESFGGPDSELNAALRELASAARSVRHLAETLERNPEALISGRREGQ